MCVRPRQWTRPADRSADRGWPRLELRGLAGQPPRRSDLSVRVTDRGLLIASVEPTDANVPRGSGGLRWPQPGDPFRPVRRRHSMRVRPVLAGEGSSPIPCQDTLWLAITSRPDVTVTSRPSAWGPRSHPAVPATRNPATSLAGVPAVDPPRGRASWLMSQSLARRSHYHPSELGHDVETSAHRDRPRRPPCHLSWPGQDDQPLTTPPAGTVPG
jgi:hypothetical protein